MLLIHGIQPVGQRGQLHNTDNRKITNSLFNTLHWMKD